MITHDSSCACLECHIEGRFEATCGEYCEHTDRSIDMGFGLYTARTRNYGDDVTDAELAHIRLEQSRLTQKILNADWPFNEPQLVTLSRDDE